MRRALHLLGQTKINKVPEAPGSASSDSNVSTAQSDVNNALRSFESSSDGTSSSSLECLKAAPEKK